MAKVTVIGAGNVGATAAQRLLETGLCDVVLLDIVEGLPQGKALDMAHSAYILGLTNRCVGTNDYQDTAGSDVVVITSGAARKPGMTRDQLVEINAAIVGEVAEKAAAVSPEAVLLVVTNPVDVMTWLAIKKSGFSRQRVIGLSGVLDSSRLAYLISKQINVPVTDVNAYVWGEHGQQMVVFPRLNTVKGVPITKMLAEEVISGLIAQTVASGAEVVNLLKTSSAYYAPSAAIVRMASAIIENSGEILPSAVCLDGEYGLYDVVCGVPVKLGEKGVQSIVKIDLSDDEQKLLAKSAESIKKMIANIPSG